MSTPLVSPLSAQLATDPKQLAAQLKSQHARAGAEEFEASLFTTVLQNMEKNLSLEDEQDSDAGHDTWSALGVRAISQALAQRHVLGIAQTIEHSLGLDQAGPSPLGSAAAACPKKICSPLKISLKSSAPSADESSRE
jgi:Rod binding domain-containing protein